MHVIEVRADGPKAIGLNPWRYTQGVFRPGTTVWKRAINLDRPASAAI